MIKWLDEHAAYGGAIIVAAIGSVINLIVNVLIWTVIATCVVLFQTPLALFGYIIKRLLK